MKVENECQWPQSMLSMKTCNMLHKIQKLEIVHSVNLEVESIYVDYLENNGVICRDRVISLKRRYAEQYIDK